MPPFYFVATFWGRSFADYVCRYAIPSLLSPNNIDALDEQERALFLFSTAEEDWDYLRRQPIFRYLESRIDVELIVNAQGLHREHKYTRMSRGHALLAGRCHADGAIAININPDSIYPDGSVATAQALARAGKRVVLCTAIRFDMEGIDSELQTTGLMSPDARLSVSKRTAVGIGLRNLHPESMASDWTARNFGRLHPQHERRHFLTCCIWRVPGENGAIIITHNWAPFMVNYASLGEHKIRALDGRALDGNYVFENFWSGDFNGIHIVQDSDELFLLGLTPHNEMMPPDDAPVWLNAPMVGQWSRGLVLNRTVYDETSDDMRRQAYKIPVCWHSRDINKQWGPLKSHVDALIAKYVSEDAASTKSRVQNPAERRWHQLVRRLI